MLTLVAVDAVRIGNQQAKLPSSARDSQQQKKEFSYSSLFNGEAVIVNTLCPR